MRLLVTPQTGDAYELWAVPLRVEQVLEPPAGDWPRPSPRIIGFDLEFRACTLWTARAVSLVGAPPPQVCEIEATAARDLVRWRWADASGISLETALDVTAADPRWAWLDEDIRRRNVKKPPGLVKVELLVERPTGRFKRGPRKPRPTTP